MIRLSQIFRPFNAPPRKKFIKLKKSADESSSKGYKLLCQYGFIRQSSTGMYSILPVGQRIIEKLIKLLDFKMGRIGAQKMYIPLLSKRSLWMEADMYDKSSEELFELHDRKQTEFVLNPTHEQSFSDLLSSEIMSYKNFPKLLYQIAPKFRDEHRAKLGLLRSKEFLMKDLYSFDIGPSQAETTYNLVTSVYMDIFNDLGIKFVKVESPAESHISMAHEYFFHCEVGDDKLYTCKSCETTFKTSAIADRKGCPHCLLYFCEEGYTHGIEITGYGFIRKKCPHCLVLQTKLKKCL